MRPARATARLALRQRQRPSLLTVDRCHDPASSGSLVETRGRAGARPRPRARRRVTFASRRQRAPARPGHHPDRRALRSPACRTARVERDPVRRRARPRPEAAAAARSSLWMLVRRRRRSSARWSAAGHHGRGSGSLLLGPDLHRHGSDVLARPAASAATATCSLWTNGVDTGWRLVLAVAVSPDPPRDSLRDRAAGLRRGAPRPACARAVQPDLRRCRSSSSPSGPRSTSSPDALRILALDGQPRRRSPSRSRGPQAGSSPVASISGSIVAHAPAMRRRTMPMANTMPLVTSAHQSDRPASAHDGGRGDDAQCCPERVWRWTPLTAPARRVACEPCRDSSCHGREHRLSSQGMTIANAAATTTSTRDPQDPRPERRRGVGFAARWPAATASAGNHSLPRAAASCPHEHGSPSVRIRVSGDRAAARDTAPVSSGQTISD